MRPQITSIKSESIQYFQKHFTKQQNLHNQKEHVEQQESVVSRDELQSITETINELLEPVRTNLKFEYHEELNEYYVTVINPKTNETIREIPPKKMLDMYAAMVGFVGLLVDEKI
ncbi:MAG TPA: flagellar protein FlaG [Bacillota bacterium]|nr:flagellar protein FlaG [Bacillota bacterium]